MQINLKRVQQEREHLEKQIHILQKERQELDELKKQLNKMESTREFVSVLTEAQEELYRQAEGLKSMGRALEELLYRYRQTEEQILEEYEQERMELPRFSVSSVNFTGHALSEADIHIRF